MELYEQLFNIENAVTVDISMDKSEIDKLQADYQKYTARDENKKSEIYRKANVTIKVGSKSYTIDEVGIRLKGNQSLEPFYASNGTPNICSFKLSFDETFDDKDEYLGTISLKNMDLDSLTAEYAITTRKKARGKGVGFTATGILLKKAFKEYGLHRVYLNVFSDNAAAIKMYERCGFHFEGEFRDHIKRDGEYVNWKWFGMLENEFDEQIFARRLCPKIS